MATYVYETTDPSTPARRFELQQSMKESALTHDPETGEPVRRVITGGYGYVSSGGSGGSGGKGGAAGAKSSGGSGGSAAGGSCGTGCGCH